MTKLPPPPPPPPPQHQQHARTKEKGSEREHTAEEERKGKERGIRVDDIFIRIVADVDRAKRGVGRLHRARHEGQPVCQISHTQLLETAYAFACGEKEEEKEEEGGEGARTEKAVEAGE